MVISSGETGKVCYSNGHEWKYRRDEQDGMMLRRECVNATGCLVSLPETLSTSIIQSVSEIYETEVAFKLWRNTTTGLAT